MRRQRPYHSLDLVAGNALPRGWQEEIRGVGERRGVATILTGSGSTSRESRKDQAIAVRVVDGHAVKAELPWLWDLYAGPLKAFASTCFRKPIYVANLVHTAVNINVLTGRGARYEWHVDSNPVTGLLFVTDSVAGLGGFLVFRTGGNQRVFVRPRAGLFICFDAREMEHRVAPLRRPGERISVPMNYYDSDTEQLRPADLDGQIYTTEQLG